MIGLFVRFSLSTVPKIIAAVVGLIELAILLRVLFRVLFGEENRFSLVLTAVTEPIIRPVRSRLGKLVSLPIDVSPAATVLLLELISGIINWIF